MPNGVAESIFINDLVVDFDDLVIIWSQDTLINGMLDIGGIITSLLCLFLMSIHLRLPILFQSTYAVGHIMLCSG